MGFDRRSFRGVLGRPTTVVRRSIAAASVTALLVVGVTACSGSSNDGASAAGDDPAATAAGSAGSTVDGAVELWDATVVHEIAVDFDTDAYDAMIATYQESGEKEWIEATVTIDGTTYERVGLRLKGNSSLMGLRGGGGGGGGGGGPAGGGGPGSGASASSPAELPWLIRFDEFVDDQLHQGYADVVVRSNQTTTSLNESVALDLLDDAGLASQFAMSTSFSVNGSDPVLRLAIEHPDDDAWQDRSFADSGALYKAESTGDWSYRGDDPASYDEVFDQEGGKKVADLTLLIDLLRFLDEADDATFESELPERVDVESFATYLAMMDLLENFDDIDGPGNNAYLWWDEATGQFTIVPWDLNLAFGSMNGGGGGFPGGGGGRGPGGGTNGDTTGDATSSTSTGATPTAAPELPPDFDPDDLPEGFDPSDLPQAPEGFEPPQGGGFGGGRPGGGGGGAFGRSNVLVERFRAVEDFEALYQEKLTELRAELFASGTAESRLDARATVLGAATDLVATDDVESESSAIATKITATAEVGG